MLHFSFIFLHIDLIFSKGEYRNECAHHMSCVSLHCESKITYAVVNLLATSTIITHSPLVLLAVFHSCNLTANIQCEFSHQQNASRHLDTAPNIRCYWFSTSKFLLYRFLPVSYQIILDNFKTLLCILWLTISIIWQLKVQRVHLCIMSMNSWIFLFTYN